MHLMCLKRILFCRLHMASRPAVSIGFTVVSEMGVFVPALGLKNADLIQPDSR